MNYLKSWSHFHGGVVDIDCSWHRRVVRKCFIFTTWPKTQSWRLQVTLLGWGSQVGRLQARWTRAALDSPCISMLLTVKLLCCVKTDWWRWNYGMIQSQRLFGRPLRKELQKMASPARLGRVNASCLELLMSSPLRHISIFMINSCAADHRPANYHPLGCWHRAGQVLLGLIIEVLLKLYQVPTCQDHCILILLQASVQKTGRLIIAHEAGAVSC